MKILIAFMLASEPLLTQEDPALVGTWEGRFLSRNFVVTFKADGSSVFNDEPFQWKRVEDRITLTDAGGNTQRHEFKIDAGRLKISGGDLEGSITLKRRGAETAAAPVPLPPPLKPLEITGTWELQNPSDPLRLALAADGTGALNGVPVRWKFEGGSLTLTVVSTGVEKGFQARVTVETLTLSGGGLPAEIVLSRAAATGPDKRLVGRWQSASGAGFEFREDGSVVNSRGTFPYTAGGGMLFFTSNGTVFSASYSIDTDRLVLNDGQGRKVEFAKLTGDRPVAAAARPGAGRNIAVNGVKLADDTVTQLERAFNVRILDGAYWYDARCGAWGLDGGPTIGLIPASLNLGGAMQPNASRGNTGVFVNGRQLPLQDVVALQQITQVLQGRYWLDGTGNVGYEGNPTVLLNLTQLQNKAKQGSTYHSRSWLTGIGSGGDGKTSYVMGKDFSVIIGE
jgi:hypothetical protein